VLRFAVVMVRVMIVRMNAAAYIVFLVKGFVRVFSVILKHLILYINI